MQLCIPWLDFPLTPVSYKPRRIRKFTAKDAADIDLDGRRILIVCGENRPYSAEQQDFISRFARRFNCAVYVNHLSNYHGLHTVEGNLMLLTMQTDEFVSNFARILLYSLGVRPGIMRYTGSCQFLSFQAQSIGASQQMGRSLIHMTN